jgi:hypothetical protein
MAWFMENVLCEEKTGNYEIKGALWKIKRVIQGVLKQIPLLPKYVYNEFLGCFFRGRLKVKGWMA